MLKQILDYILVEERLDLFFLHFAWIFPLIIMTCGLLTGIVRKPFLATLKNFFLISLCGPLISILWTIYNLISDHFGIDSVTGLLVNLTMFVTMGLIIGFLIRRVKSHHSQSIDN